jgi:hypothetical protein
MAMQSRKVKFGTNLSAEGAKNRSALQNRLPISKP